MSIQNSSHVPPHHDDVPRYIDEMCDYVNDNWETESALHLCSYVMWRVNWIHPFVDGNGRTTRAVSYYVLCARLGFQIPGVTTLPELIAKDKFPYYDALDAADAAAKEGHIDVSKMEELIRELFAGQMLMALERANRT